MSTLTQLALRDFRNIHRAELVIPVDGIAVVGENGQGKTNLLEAIYYFQLLRSVRGARDADLVRFDAPAFHLSAHVTTDRAHVASAAFELSSKRKKLLIDGAEPERLSDALGVLPSVMVSPRDVTLITGAPGERRRFLDVVLALTSRSYLAALQRYRAALVQRNSALRAVARTGRGEDTIEAWEPALAEHGARLLVMRAAWVTAHAGAFADLCAAIGERAPVSMSYATNAANASPDALLRLLAAKRAHDIRRGLTQTGPHRDDLPLSIDGRELRQFGSAGQQRTAAIALRMLEAATLRAHNGHDPVLLLDDPFAELDTRRATHILELLRTAGLGQTILTVPRSSDIPAGLTRLERWNVQGGALTRAKVSA